MQTGRSKLLQVVALLLYWFVLLQVVVIPIAWQKKKAEAALVMQAAEKIVQVHASLAGKRVVRFAIRSRCACCRAGMPSGAVELIECGAWWLLCACTFHIVGIEGMPCSKQHVADEPNGASTHTGHGCLRPCLFLACSFRCCGTRA